VLRIHFTVEDMARVVLTLGGDRPLTDVVSSVFVLQSSDQVALVHGWRRRARRMVQPTMMPLLKLLTPPPAAPPSWLARCESTLDEALAEAFSPAGRHQMTAWVRQWRPPTPANQLLARADREAVAALTNAIRVYYRAMILPYQAQIRATAAAEHAARSAVMAAEGVEGLLATLEPGASWESPVLTVSRHVGGGDFHLSGRRLVLSPGFFDAAGPCSGSAPPGNAEPCRAWYPPRLRHGVFTEATVDHDGAFTSLAALLGHNRGSVLEAIAAYPGCTTSELARRVGIAASRASEHATVLRNAGLVGTTRDGQKVRHSTTALGQGLLDQQ
jgi:DNA-binding transcriptional ArsR family regulator